MTTAINEVTQDGRDRLQGRSDQRRTVVMPNNVFGSYEALAARLSVLRPERDSRLRRAAGGGESHRRAR